MTYYRDFRARSEFAFRQEILGFIEDNIAKRSFFGRELAYVLKRMQEFWAFKGTYLLYYSFDTGRASTAAVSVLGKAEAFGISRQNGRALGIQWQEFHPYPYLHVSGTKPHSVSDAFNEAMPKIEEIVNQNNKSRTLEINNGDCEFVVVVPTYRGVFIFVFAVRDQREASSLESRSPGSVSILCRDMIFETCCEIVGEFHNVREFVERDKQTQIQCLETLDRMIEKEITAVQNELGVQLESLRDEDNLESLKKEVPKVQEGLVKIVSVPRTRIREVLKRLKSSGQF